MTGPFVSRRRADEFDALVSGPAVDHDAVTAARFAELLEVVGALRSVPEVTPRADFVADLRSQLVVEAARMTKPVDDELRARLTPARRQGARERRAATLLGGFAVVAASGSMAMASQAALPGDVLYPVKRALENAETNLQSDDAAKAATLLSHAEQRLQEVQQLTDEGADADAVANALHDFTEQSNQAAKLALDHYASTGDSAQLADFRSFTARSMLELDDLGDLVPDDARAALIAAAQSVQQADAAAYQACPTCGDGAVTELPEFAAAPIELLPTSLLSLRTTQETVSVPRGFLDRVENMANNLPQDDQRGTRNGSDDGTAGVEPPATEPDVDDVVEPDVDPGPLDDLGDRIKRDLDGGQVTVDLDDAVDDVVSGIGGLVDTITTTPTTP